MKKLLFGIMLLISSNAIGQLNLDWAFKFDFGNCQIKDGLVDAYGSSYVLGSYSQWVDIDPAVDFDSIIYNQGGTFLAKYDNSGNFVWGFPLQCSNGNLPNNTIWGTEMEFDTNGNIVIIGRSTCPIDFDPSGNSEILNLNNLGGFLASYNSNGQYLWSRPIVEGPDLMGGYAESIKIDSDNNIFLGIEGSGDLDVNPGSVNYFSGPSLGKYDIAGNLIWIRSLANVSGLNINPVEDVEVLSSGEIVCASREIGANLVIQKFDQAGNQIFIHEYGVGTSVLAQCQLTSDNSGNVFIAFVLIGSVEINLVSGQNLNLFSGPSSSLYSSVFMRMNSAGLIDWVVTMDIIGGNTEIYDACIDSNGDIYYSGTCMGGISISSPNLNESYSVLGISAYILKINQQGSVSWFSKMNSDAQAYSNGLSIWVDSNGSLFQGGQFIQFADMDPSSSQFILTNQESILPDQNVCFIRKLNQCAATYPANTISYNGNCSSPLITITAPNADYYSWSNGDTTQTITVNSIGTYSVYLGNTQGCYAAVNQVTLDSSSFTVPEICDGIDSDCDGVIDNGFDSDGDGISICNGDCNDNNAAINVSALEICNGIDDNCNSQTDEGFDIDTDNFTICNGDCDDTNSLIYPGAPEILDLIDNNCDGQIDEGLSPDADGDGFTVADGDCDDNNASVNPNATELCNGIDDNCNTQVDEGFDLDADTFTICNGDCDDTNALIYPGAPEVLDSLDNNCNGQIDEGFNPDPDADGDGFSLSEGDCNDADPNINPGATELCNGIDDNCNSTIDEGFDLDGDGETSCEGDCNDNDSLVNTSAIELCNSIDDNCDTLINEGLTCDELTIQIPNGISPNSDGFNDAWYLPWLNGMTGYSIVISNRWGQVIFQTNDYSTPWDGTYLGNSLPAADYFYVIKLSDNTIYEGVISIKY